jgi:alanyl-tRNA synthetase
MRTAAQIRQDFLEFFRRHDHTLVPPAAVIPHEDPTLLFTNAGMNQFKPIFLGQRAPDVNTWAGAVPGLATRAANSQPCIRAGGKHNDLDDVGHDTYHHTCFEMLGNWSFGDYFKREAIAWAWELLTQVWGLDPTRLHATYFGGNPAQGLEPDAEARELWAQIAKLPPDHIHPGSMKDNFWEMGDTGPCGPCSEIHIDLTPDRSGAKLVNAGDARVMEIWNLVFIQFNRNPDGSLSPLPARHVDTGMGFERVAAVIQGKTSNYDTDVFTPIFAAIRRVTGAAAYGGRLEDSDGAASAERGAGDRAAVMADVAYRVIADHIRTLTFAISDGCLPDKEGRGYVLRRILRRAVRYGWQYLNMHKPFLHQLVPAVVESLGGSFPGLAGQTGRVAEVIREEEESFARTLERGLALFADAAETAARDHHGEIRGADAFKLHDTFGFPIDLTQIMAAERGLRVDIGEYERLIEEARERSRATGAALSADEDHVISMLAAASAATDDMPKYEYPAECAAVLRRMVELPGGASVASASANTEIAFVADRTNFYAEQGGQVSDTGTVVTESGEIEVRAALRRGEVVVHRGRVIRGKIDVPSECRLRVAPRRAAIMQNHTATHILNWALRETLGEHIQQKGSLVDHEKTRFDFSHPKGVTPEELAKIEDLCIQQIRANHTVFAENAPQAAALKINGLRAVFGEKYPDIVRVVSIGAPVGDLLRSPDRADWRKYSIEFCGGTHVRSTAEIGRFVLVHEESVAKGIRRLIGISGEAAARAEAAGRNLLERVEQLRHGPAGKAGEALAGLQNELNAAQIPLRMRLELRDALGELQEVAKKAQKAAAAQSGNAVRERLDALLPSAAKLGATTVLVAEMPDVPIDQLKHGADIIKQRVGSAAVIFGVRTAPNEDNPAGKATLLAALSDDLVKRGLRAGDLVKAIAPLVDGGGGGSPTMAQAGGKNPAKLDEALEAGRNWLAERLG